MCVLPCHPLPDRRWDLLYLGDFSAQVLDVYFVCDVLLPPSTAPQGHHDSSDEAAVIEAAGAACPQHLPHTHKSTSLLFCTQIGHVKLLVHATLFFFLPVLKKAFSDASLPTLHTHTLCCKYRTRSNVQWLKFAWYTLHTAVYNAVASHLLVVHLQ